MIRIIKSTGLLFLLCIACTVAGAQSLIYYNAFNNGESSWTNYDDQLSNAIITGGKYILTHKLHTSSVVAPPVPVDYSRDFAIQTSVSHVAGATGFPAGLTFFGRDAINLYYFGISANGNFQIGSFNDGNTKAIVNWTP